MEVIAKFVDVKYDRNANIVNCKNHGPMYVPLGITKCPICGAENYWVDEKHSPYNVRIGEYVNLEIIDADLFSSFCDYLNEYAKENPEIGYPLNAEEIIAANGWKTDGLTEEDVCKTDNEKITMNENGDWVIVPL